MQSSTTSHLDATPTPPLPYLPPEIIQNVLEQLKPTRRTEPRGPRSCQRNSTLASAALVSKGWKVLAYAELYGHLILEWKRGSVVEPLLRSFATRPSLHALVRHVETYFTTAEEAEYQPLNIGMGRSPVTRMPPGVPVRRLPPYAMIHQYDEDRVRMPPGVPFRRPPPNAMIQMPEFLEGPAGYNVTLRDASWYFHAGRRHGAIAFWKWLSGFTELHSLTVSGFITLLREPSLELARLGSSLRHLSVLDALEDDTPHIPGPVHTLIEEATQLKTLNIPYPYHNHGPTHGSILHDLRYARIATADAGGATLHNRLPDTLTTLYLDFRPIHPHPPTPNPPIESLPTSLRVLRLHLSPATLHLARTPLPSTGIQHLWLNTWPTDDFLQSVSSTLLSLTLTNVRPHTRTEAPDSEPWPAWPDQLARALALKARILPHLRTMRMDWGYCDRAMQEEVDAVAQTAEGFQLFAGTSAATKGFRLEGEELWE